MYGLQYLGVAGQTEVIVGADHNNFFTFGDNLSTGHRGYPSEIRIKAHRFHFLGGVKISALFK
jgi:hypothetical protein